MKKLFQLLTMAACIYTGSAGAQQLFAGRVAAAGSQQPLELASITVDGGQQRVLSDAQGHFFFRSPKKVAMVTVSYVGYKPRSLSLEAKKNTVVLLSPDALRLEEFSLVGSSGARFKMLSRVDLSLRPVNNTQELLRLVPGLFIAQHAGGGKAEQIFLRGFDCDHGTDVSVGFDGMPVNMPSHAHGQGYADSHFIIPETVQSIDYGVGPYYAAQGDFTTAGYVQFRSYDALEHSRVQVEAGRFGTARALLMLDLLQKHKEKEQAYIASEYYYTNGPTQHAQDFHRFNVFGKYRRALGDRHWLSVSASAFDSHWNASGQIPERVEDSIGRFGSIDPSEGGATQRQNVNLQLRSRMGDDASWENQLYYSHYRFNLYSDFTFLLNDPVHGDEIQQQENRNILGGLSKFTRKYNVARGSLQSVYAAGFRADATGNSRLAHVEKRAFLEDVKRGDIHESNWFAYSSQQWSHGRWLLEGALRLDGFHFNYQDRISTDQPAAHAKALLQPKFNIQYTLSRKLQVFGKFGRGFHSNDTRVVVAQQGREVLPAAWGADLGFSVKPAARLYFSATAWWLRLQQEFVYVGDEGVVEPSGRTLRRGVDLLARFQAGPYIYGIVNANIADPRSLDAVKGQDHIPLAPTFSSTGGVYYKRPLGLNGGLSYRFLADRPANEDNSIVAKGYFITDLTLSYTKRKWEAGIIFENLFDVKWNEAQFATESQLQGEAAPVTELHFTPGNPTGIRARIAFFF